MRIASETCNVKRVSEAIANNYLNGNMNNLLKSWNGRTIRIRKDRYVSLTDMAQASGKLFANWRQLKSTESYLSTLSGIIGIPIMDLLQSQVGGSPELTGTWGHPKLAIRFAQWCSDELAVQVDCWMDELLTTGKVELALPKPQSALELLQQQLTALAAVVEASVEHERKIAALEEQNAELQHRLEAIDMETAANTAELERFSNGHGFWVSIAGWCSRHGIKKPTQWMNTQGRKASAMCKQKGLKPVPVPDARYGQVNTYPDSVLAELNWD